MKIIIKYEYLGNHVHVRFFFGVDDASTSASVGKLIMRSEEWPMFRELLKFGYVGDSSYRVELEQGRA